MVIVGLAVMVPVVLAGKTFRRADGKGCHSLFQHTILHRDEQVAIAADPYDTQEKAKSFSIDFAGHGYLPCFSRCDQ